MQNTEKENKATSDNGRARDNYPTSGRPADHYPTDNAKDSSRYSHPDQRPDKRGPGGEAF